MQQSNLLCLPENYTLSYYLYHVILAPGCELCAVNSHMIIHPLIFTIIFMALSKIY